MRKTTAAQASLVASLAMALAAPAFTACGSKSETPPAPTAAETPPAPAPEPLVALVAPTNLDAAKVALGRRLFHDPILSGDNTLSCATCHSLDMGGAEHRPTSTGIRGQIGPINSPTVLNSSLNFVQFWDGRAATLEAQAVGPIANPLEMGSSVDAALVALKAKPDYVQLFAAAYPDGVTATNLAHALAEYERSLVTLSPFDKFLGGELGAISEQAKRGYETFKSVGCTTCHTGQNVGGSMFQKMGLVSNYFELRGTPLTEADHGRFNVTHSEADRHMFKVPTLRNIALTAPYFHDGSQQTLEGAVKIMAKVQLGRDLTDAQIADIVAFLGTLTGELPAGARLTAAETLLLPSAPPSNGAPGTPTPVHSGESGGRETSGTSGGARSGLGAPGGPSGFSGLGISGTGAGGS